MEGPDFRGCAHGRPRDQQASHTAAMSPGHLETQRRRSRAASIPEELARSAPGPSLQHRPPRGGRAAEGNQCSRPKDCPVE
eukprot:15433416-Alexandrium_andersonii.AAC.1